METPINPSPVPAPVKPLYAKDPHQRTHLIFGYAIVILAVVLSGIVCVVGHISIPYVLNNSVGQGGPPVLVPPKQMQAPTGTTSHAPATTATSTRTTTSSTTPTATSTSTATTTTTVKAHI